MVFFTSDPHFNHQNIAGPKVSSWKSGYRNFETTHEMNKALIQNINNTVSEEDELYILGDFAFKGAIADFRHAIRCPVIHLVYGNHDRAIKRSNELQGLFSSVQTEIEQDFAGRSFYMHHYAHRIWPGSHRGIIHLYGHSHGKLEPKDWGLSMDVGVDTHPEFRPYSLDEVLRVMSSKNPKIVDNHGKNAENT